jgi:hypothetical protein
VYDQLKKDSYVIEKDDLTVEINSIRLVFKLSYTVFKGRKGSIKVLLKI